MSGVAAKRGFASAAVFCAVVGIVPSVKAQVCQNSMAGWRPGCESNDTACQGNRRARYHTYVDTYEYLKSLRDTWDLDDHMAIINLGESAWSKGYDPNDPSLSWLFETYLVRVAENANAPDIEHPPILIVGALHAFEWVASEVALGYVDYLVRAANGLTGDDQDTEDADQMLQNAEFWFVVNGNVGGRRYGDVVDPNCSDSDCETGNPFDNLHSGQRKNVQWAYTSREQASDDSLDMSRSGYCNFDTDAAASLGVVGSEEVVPWTQWGINVENNFSAVWLGGGATNYDRLAMLKALTPDTPPYTDYSDIPSTAPELFPCGSENSTGNDRCEAHFPNFPDPILGSPHGGHKYCLQRGTDPITNLPLYGCFMASSFPSTNLCNSNNGVTDELGIPHVCLRTQTSPGAWEYLLWGIIYLTPKLNVFKELTV